MDCVRDIRSRKVYGMEEENEEIIEKHRQKHVMVGN
jgi:hypothetical protein